MTTNERIHILIERYFDASTTETEENELRLLLADPETEPTAEVEEARAVMGYTSLQRAIHHPKSGNENRVKKWTRGAAAAAMLTGIITVAYHALPHSEAAPSYATVYTDGQVITSTDEALAIMHAQLSAMGSAEANGATADAFSALDNMLADD